MKRKREHTPVGRDKAVGSGIPTWARVVFTVIGLVLLLVGAVANYSGDFLMAARGKVFFRLPGSPEHEYSFFPIWFVIIGLPLALLLVALASRRFRKAIRHPWHDSRLAAPLVAVLVYLVFSLVPWEPTNLKPEDSGSRMVFFVIVSGAGFALLLAGLYRQLAALDRTAQRVYDWLTTMPRWQFLGICFGFTFAAANLMSLVAFEHMPHIQDSISQVFQARIFESGRLYLPTPRFPDFFDYTHIINVSGQSGHPAEGYNVANWPGPAGRWYSQYPFLHSLILMLGVFVGIPWMINPLLGALTVPAIYFLGREVYDEQTGRLAAALGCLTPFIFNMSAEFMNHSSALLLATLFILFFFRTLNKGRWHQALLAGVMIGLTANVRAYTAAAIALPFAGCGLYLVVREPRRYLGPFALMVVAGGTVTGLSLVYNWLTNGHPLLFAYLLKLGPGLLLGFVKSGWGDMHTPLRGLVNTGHDLNLLNKFLFEWPIPALLPAGVLFASGTRDRRDWLLAATILSLSFAYFFYWFHNVCFGPRFLYESAACMLLLTVRGFGTLGPMLRRTFGAQVPDRFSAVFAGRAIPVLLLLFLAIGAPPLVKYYHAYGWVNGTLQRTVRKQGLKNAVVFCHQLGSGFSANRLDLGGDIVYAKDYGMLNAALTVAYPGRKYFYGSEDTLRELAVIDYPTSQLKRTLDEMAMVLADSVLPESRTIIWPFRDLPPEGLDSAVLAEKLVDFREVSRSLFTSRRKLEDYMPALACWMLKDGREHLQVFTYFDDLQSFITGGQRFTLLYVTSDGNGVIYDIRKATGDETVVPEKAGGALPVR